MRYSCSSCKGCEHWSNGCKAPFDKMECSAFYSEYKRRAVERTLRNKGKLKEE